MKTKTKLPNIVNIAIITLVTTLIWIGFGVWRILTTKSNTDIPPAILAPLDPNLDTSTLDKLRTKSFATSVPSPQSTIVNQTPVPSISPTPNP